METLLLIYMASDNDLDNFANSDFETIKKSSFESDITIVVQYDRNEFIDFPETSRVVLQRGEIIDDRTLGETNTGDPKILNQFIEESVEAYPAQRIILILWSHGSGVDDKDPYQTDERKPYFVPVEEIEMIGFAKDDTARDFLDNLELKKALDVSVKIDLLGFDACLMGMFEIAYQLRENIEVMVASQHLEPANGWNYAKILQELETSKNPMEMGREFIALHQSFHVDSNEATQSALDTTTIDAVAKSLDHFAKLLREELKRTGGYARSRKDLYYTLENSQFFSRTDYVDLIDFIHKVRDRLNFETLDAPIEELLALLDRFILANHTVGYFMNDAYGVSLYFPYENRPYNETFEMYEKLDFSKNYPNWIKLIKWFWIASQ